MNNDLMVQKDPYSPRSFAELERWAGMVANSGFVPKDYVGKPANVMIAVQMGHELGLKPLQALQHISVINGKPAVWGDAMLALVQRSGLLEFFDETLEESGDDVVAYCTFKRKGQPKQTRTFSKKDAVIAGLWGRNTWKAYPTRMLQMRARGFALRDGFSDVLNGLITGEEAQDYDVNVNTGQPVVHEAVVVDTSPAQQPAPAITNQNRGAAFAAQMNKLAAENGVKQPAPMPSAEYNPPKQESYAADAQHVGASLEEVVDAINAAKNLEELGAVAHLAAQIQDDRQKDKARAVFMSRRAELKAQAQHVEAPPAPAPEPAPVEPAPMPELDLADDDIPY